MTTELRQRAPTQPAVSQDAILNSTAPSAPSLKTEAPSADDAKAAPKTATEHPSGEEKYGRTRQIFRQISFGLYFVACVLAISSVQFLGAPLYWIDRGLYYSYMALTKQYFGLVITTMTKWWGPTTIRISGDASVAGQIRQTPDGRAEFGFPDRLVLIANHQLYTDWLYLWWVAYANDMPMHGWIYIILKESLKFIPIIGTGMMFYGFIFMSRKMSVDRPRLAHRLNKLKLHNVDPATGAKSLNPMWLLLFPEGTNTSANGRAKSASWAAKNGIKDHEHVLLPRSTGMYFCLSELRGTVEWVYDCTVAYEGILRGQYGEDLFTLSSTYFQGRPPRSVNFYWRRFRVADIPFDTQEAFDAWLRERWVEKDALMEQYLQTGRLPPNDVSHEKRGELPVTTPDYIETEVRTRYIGEVLQIFVIPGTFLLVWNLLSRLYASVVGLVGFGS